MASDNLNLLEGIAGAISGFTSVYLPLQQELFKKRLNSTPVSDFEAITGKKTGLDPRKFLTDNEMELELYKLKADDEKNKEISTREFERQKIDLQRKSDIEKYQAEHKSIGQLYPDQTLEPKEFRESGFENLTPEQGTSLIKSRHDKSMALSLREDQRQDKLEEDYRKLREKGVATRSGDLGIQNSKVSQAIHLRNLLDQFYDPNTDEFKVPPSQYEELAIGMATLVGAGTAPTESMKEGIRQRTLKGDIGRALTYATGTNYSGSSKNVFDTLADSVDRQGLVSEDLRNNYYSEFSKMRPTRLDPERAKSLESVDLGASYKSYLEKSPSFIKRKSSNPFNLNNPGGGKRPSLDSFYTK